MNHEIQRHQQMIEASGMGLLPGIALAFGLSLLVMAALIFFETMWVTVAVLFTLFGITGVVTWIVVKLIAADGGSEH
jgi:hypothetical protein